MNLLVGVLSFLVTSNSCLAFRIYSMSPKLRSSVLLMKLGVDEKVLLVGVAADSGCGKSTFMRRLTSIFGGNNASLLGGGFKGGGWETNTLVSDMTTVLCLDDYHLNDRQGRKKTNLTALNVAEQNFDLMAEQLVNLKTGKSISKPIYNHVNGTIDKPETITPTPIVIVEGLHPLVDPRVRRLLDFTIYLDISDEIKFAWKIQRDMEERGWIREQVQADIEKRKPDFAAFVAPQMQFSDMVISVLPSTRGLKSVGGMPGLKVKLLQRVGKRGLPPAYMVDADSHVTIRPSARLVRAQSEGGLQLVSYRDRFYDHEVSVLEMEGRVADAQGFAGIERLLSDTGARTPTEISSLMQSGSASTPGALDGTGLFQTIAAVKLRNYYEHATGTKIGA